jgi:hypothetical protein
MRRASCLWGPSHALATHSSGRHPHTTRSRLLHGRFQVGVLLFTHLDCSATADTHCSATADLLSLLKFVFGPRLVFQAAYRWRNKQTVASGRYSRMHLFTTALSFRRSRLPSLTARRSSWAPHARVGCSSATSPQQPRQQGSSSRQSKRRRRVCTPGLGAAQL